MYRRKIIRSRKTKNIVKTTPSPFYFNLVRFPDSKCYYIRSNNICYILKFRPFFAERKIITIKK